MATRIGGRFLGAVGTMALAVPLAAAATAQQPSTQPPVSRPDNSVQPVEAIPTPDTAGPPAVTPGTVAAPDVAVGAAPPQAAAPSEGLGDIIVTAQRREESLQKAAVAVDVVKGADLVSAGVVGPERLGQLVPALTVEGTANGNLIFVRGVGNFTLTPNSDPSTAFNYDGVYVGRPTSTAGTFYDLQRVEVLKGPQGTLYGRNATAGAINVIPVQPELGKFGGYGTISYGNYNTVTTEGAVNAPLGPDGAIRASGSYFRHDPYLADGTGSERVGAGRLQMKAKPTPDLSIRTSFDYAHQGGTGAATTYLDRWTYNPATQTFTAIPSGIGKDQGVFTPESQAFRRQVTAGTAGRTLTDLSRRPTLDNDYYGALLQVDWHTPIGNLTVLPAWRYAKIDNLTAPGFTIGQREKDDQESVEARLVSDKPGFLAYNLGLYYFNENIRNRTSLSLSSAATFSDTRYHTESYAAYGRLTANLTRTLRLVGGARYTHDSKDFSGASRSLSLVCTLRTGCPTAPLLPYTDDFGDQPYRPAASGRVLPVSPGAIVARNDTAYGASLGKGKVTWRGAVEWDVAPRSLAYASVETGYRSGGFNAAAGYLTYEPETITAYTVGVKNRFLQNRVQLNLEAFWWDYRNQQLSHVGIDQAGRPANFTQNIGHSRIRGLEAETQIAVTPTTLLTGDVQYLDSKYLRFSYLTPFAAGRPYSGCGVTANGTASYTVDCTGKTAYNSPKWTINLGAQQTIRLDRYKFVAGVDTQYKSSRYVFFDYQPGQFVRPTWTTNAQVAFSPDDERWTIAAFVRNIENNRIVIFAPPVPQANLLPATTTPPRTYGVRLAYKF